MKKKLFSCKGFVIGTEKYFDGYRTYFKVDHQTFYLSEVETEFNAKWYARNLMRAFKVLLTTFRHAELSHELAGTYNKIGKQLDGENKRLETKSHKTLTDVRCLQTGKCQETEGFKGGPHEGLDMCEDGCMWYNPKKK